MKSFQNSNITKDNLIIERTKDMKRYFSKEEIQNENKYMERCSTSLIIRKMQIKNTVYYQYKLIRVAKIKNSENTMEKWCIIWLGLP